MVVDLSQNTNLEGIGRAAFVMLHDGLNDEIAAQNTLWASRDTAFFAEIGRGPRVIELEPVKNDNFVIGHKPSLMNAPITAYPNVTVMAYQAAPIAGQGFDHEDNYNVRLFVELMVKSERDEEEVNARTHRMADAVVNVLSADRTLGGTVTEMATPATVELSDVFIRAEERGRGTRWFWQGARLDYIVRKDIARYQF